MLVSNLISRSRRLRHFINPVFVAIAVVWFPVGAASGQSTESDGSSVRIAQPTPQVGANGTASINPANAESQQSAQATFSSRPIPTTPTAPQSILLPATPNQDSFTEPQSNSGITAQEVMVAGDGSQAIGTFASGEPRQNQSNSNTPAFQQPSGGRSFEPSIPSPDRTNPANANPTLPPITDNGLRGGAGGGIQNPSFSPQVNSSAFSSSRSFSDSAMAEDESENELTQQPQPPRPTAQFQRPSSMRSASEIGGQSEAASSEGIRRIPPPAFNAQPVDRSTATDNRVQPTGFNQPAKQQSDSNDLALAQELMDRYSIDRAPEPLPGRPVRLLEMLQSPIPTNQRTRMINEYWTAYYDWCTLLSRAEYSRWLNSLSSSSPTDQAMLTAARSAAAGQLLAAEIQLGKSQSRLLDFLPVRQDGLSPLPADQPLIHKYRTNYELYQSRGMIPTRLRGINEILPKTLDLISKRASTVNLAKKAADNARNALASRQADVAYVLEAARLWRSAEQDLIGSVVTYNQAIADYSQTITRGNPTAEQVVSMLIAKPKSQRSAIPTGNGFNQQSVQFSAQSSGRGNQGAPSLQGARPRSQPGRVVDSQGGFNRNPAAMGQGFNAGQPSPGQTGQSFLQPADRAANNSGRPFQPNAKSAPPTNPFSSNGAQSANPASQFSSSADSFRQPNPGRTNPGRTNPGRSNFGGGPPTGTPRTANSQSGQFNNEFGR